MLRFIFAFFLITGCSHRVIESGGDKLYLYDVLSDYTVDNLKSLSPLVIKSRQRDPQVGKLDALFSPGMGGLNRVGIIVFESLIQPTSGGVTGDDKIYLSSQGKQLLTEKLLEVWEQGFPILGADLNYIPTSKILKAKTFNQYGQKVVDHLKSRRSSLDPDDIFFIGPGKLAPVVSVINPRGMRDLSLLTVPASELMMGPKFSEHHKHFVNELAAELKLDAVIVVMNKISWTASKIKKNSHEIVPEEFTINISSTLIVPYDDYHRRLEKLGMNDRPKTNLSFRNYEADIRSPIMISFPETDQSFSTIQAELLNPLLKTYNDLSQMMMMKMVDDLRMTK